VRRSGFQLAELMVAIILATGPMLVALNLIHSNSRGAHYNQEQATARFILVDLSELLAGRTSNELKELDGLAGRSRLNQMVQNRIDQMPEAVREQYADAVAPLIGRFHMNMEENAGGVPGLVQVTLAVNLGKDVTVTVPRFFRVDARPAPINPKYVPIEPEDNSNDSSN
jgi:hypothetical protein